MRPEILGRYFKSVQGRSFMDISCCLIKRYWLANIEFLITKTPKNPIQITFITISASQYQQITSCLSCSENKCLVLVFRKHEYFLINLKPVNLATLYITANNPKDRVKDMTQPDPSTAFPLGTQDITVFLDIHHLPISTKSG